MQTRHVFRWLVVSVVALLAALLAFIGYEVFSTVFPGDSIVITASDGAELFSAASPGGDRPIHHFGGVCAHRRCFTLST